MDLTTNDAGKRGQEQGQLSVEVSQHVLQAPIAAGEGSRYAYGCLDGKCQKETPLLAAGSVEQGSWFVLIDSIVLLFRKLFGSAQEGPLIRSFSLVNTKMIADKMDYFTSADPVGQADFTQFVEEESSTCGICTGHCHFSALIQS